MLLKLNCDTICNIQSRCCRLIVNGWQLNCSSLVLLSYNLHIDESNKLFGCRKGVGLSVVPKIPQWSESDKNVQMNLDRSCAISEKYTKTYPKDRNIPISTYATLVNFTAIPNIPKIANIYPWN